MSYPGVSKIPFANLPSTQFSVVGIITCMQLLNDVNIRSKGGGGVENENCEYFKHLRIGHVA